MARSPCGCIKGRTAESMPFPESPWPCLSAPVPKYLLLQGMQCWRHWRGRGGSSSWGHWSGHLAIGFSGNPVAEGHPPRPQACCCLYHCPPKQTHSSAGRRCRGWIRLGLWSAPNASSLPSSSCRGTLSHVPHTNLTMFLSCFQPTHPSGMVPEPYPTSPASAD